jgi:pyruvate,water dikinase
VTVEFAVKCLGQYNTRHYMIPPANGVDYRIHNGYCYMSPVAVAPELIAGRVPQFMERAGYYFQNWDSLLANWDKKVRANIAALEALHFEKLPDVVPLDWVTEGVGLDNTYGLDGDLRPVDPASLQDLAVSFRIPEPRLCRLSGFLRLPQGTIP